MFLNLLPCATRASATTWRDLLQRIHQWEVGALPHRWFPFGKMDFGAFKPAAIDSTFNFVHFHTFDRLTGRDDLVGLSGMGTDSYFVPFSAHWEIKLATGLPALRIDYRPSLLSSERFDALVSLYRAAAASFASGLDEQIEVKPPTATASPPVSAARRRFALASGRARGGRPGG